MQWFLNLTTRTKLILSFGVMLLLLAAVSVTAYRSITAIQQSQARLYKEDFANEADLLTLRLNENGMRAAMLEMQAVTKRSDQEVWHQDAKDRSKAVDEILPRLLERNRSDPKSLRRLEELRDNRDAFKQTRETEIIPLIYEGKINEARKLAHGIQAERLLKIRSIAEELGKEAEDKARDAVVQAEQSVKETLRTLSFVEIGRAHV